ncbi:hypothetical protein KPH14_012979, partial [Odynerus spinipes]
MEKDGKGEEAKKKEHEGGDTSMDTSNAEKKKRGRPSLEEGRSRESASNRKMTDMWGDDREDRADLIINELERQGAKRKDLKKTPQKEEEKKEKEQRIEEKMQGILDVIVGKMESMKEEIHQGRENLEREIKREVKNLWIRMEEK